MKIQPRTMLLYGVVLAVVSWRLAALWHPHPAISDPEIGVSNGAQCVFLNLAILGSTERRLGRGVRLLCYSPLIGGLGLLVFQIVAPAQRPMSLYGPPLFTLAAAFGLIGAGFWVYGWARSASGSEIRFRRGMVAAALLGFPPPW